MLATLALVYLALVALGLMVAFYSVATDTTQIPGHDPICESIGLAVIYTRNHPEGATLNPRNQGARKLAFARARSCGMTADALLYMDARMSSGNVYGWHDARGVWHYFYNDCNGLWAANRARAARIVRTPSKGAPIVLTVRRVLAFAGVFMVAFYGGCVSGPEAPICGAPMNSAPIVDTIDGACWERPIDGCEGWTWHACDNTWPCMCLDSDCFCSNDGWTTK